MKRKSLIGLFVLFVASAFFLTSCGSGSPGAPGSSGSGDTGCMPLVESVVPSNTYLTTGNLTESESVDATIGVYDLPNRSDTCSGVTFTRYLVEYKGDAGSPLLGNREYQGTWYVEPNSNATFTLTFWDYNTKLAYRWPNDPRIHKYNVVFTMTGYNAFGKKITVVFQFNVTTKL